MKSMKKKMLMMLGAVSVMALTAVAANVHFKGGNPTFTDNGLTLSSAFCLSGLGNQDVTATITATGAGSSTCTNPGGNQAPGQNKIPLRLSGSQTVSAGDIKNGTVCFNVTSAGPAQPTATEAGCPNNNWEAQITDVAFSSATITVVQGGKVVLTKTVRL